MTNIEKVKRIIDAGHWVKVTFEDGDILTITSYHGNEISYLGKGLNCIFTFRNPSFKDCTIEVIQRIPTPYKAWDKVLVLSNHQKNVAEMQDMVWNVCEIESNNGTLYTVWNNKKDNFYYFPSHCLSPVFEEDSLSGKEAKVTIDGKEYSVTLKLI